MGRGSDLRSKTHILPYTASKTVVLFVHFITNLSPNVSESTVWGKEKRDPIWGEKDFYFQKKKKGYM